MKKIFLLVCAVLLTACQSHDDSHTLKVGTISGPETKLMEIAKEVAKKRAGLNVEIVEFSDSG